jgi:energy-converting hydrogenase Eha subunit C
MKIRDLVLSIVNASLYALIGIATTFGLFAIIVGGVRFWPSVFIPAVFAEVFGPVVGGLGAAIGIFVSDMVVHGNALVSLSIGVPANFIGFYVLGYIAKKTRRDSKILGIAAIVLQFVPAIALLYLYQIGFLDFITTIVFLSVATLSAIGIAISMAILMFRRGSYVYPNEAFAYTVGLMLGSLYIGLGLWAYTYIARLNIAAVPPEFQIRAPFTAALTWFLWTYYTEIPFMVYLSPPIVRAIEIWMKRYR